MAPAVVFSVLVGGLVVAGAWRAARGAERAARRRERIAAMVLHDEMTAAIYGLDLALRDDGARWLASMSESRTLTEAWHEHGQVLLGLGMERWYALSDAVTAMEPSYELAAAKPQPEELRVALAERRRLLAEGAGILHGSYLA